MNNKPTSRKRLTFEETLDVTNWLNNNRDFVSKLLPDLEQICRSIHEDLGISTTEAAVQRILLHRDTPYRETYGDTLLAIIDAVDNLYVQLGEPPHKSLGEARHLLHTNTQLTDMQRQARQLSQTVSHIPKPPEQEEALHE